MRTVTLHGNKAAGRVARVDDSDYDLVMQYRWNVNERLVQGKWPSGPYAAAKVHVGTNRYVNLFMHCLIMGRPYIDHIDRDGLNNQRYNLRPATQSQNLGNTGPRDGSSRFKGVSWDKRRARWRAQITVDGHNRCIGRFADEVQAAQAYDAAALKAFGEFAYLNFPEACGRRLSA